MSPNAASNYPIPFGLPNDFQTFSPQRIFTAVGSKITDVNFFVPEIHTAVTTVALGVNFTDVETDNTTSSQFFDTSDHLIFTTSPRRAPIRG